MDEFKKIISEVEKTGLEFAIEKIVNKVNDRIESETIDSDFAVSSLDAVVKSFSRYFGFFCGELIQFFLKSDSGLVKFSRDLVKEDTYEIYQKSIIDNYYEPFTKIEKVSFSLQPPRWVLMNKKPYQTWWDKESYEKQLKEGIFMEDFDIKRLKQLKIEMVLNLATLMGEKDLMEEFFSE